MPTPRKKSGRRRTTLKSTPSDVGNAIIDGLTEFRDALAAGVPLQSRFTVRTVEIRMEPGSWSSDDIRALRDGFSASQAVFARLLGVSVKTVQAWEQGGTPPRMARRLLDLIRADPAPWKKMLENAAAMKHAA